MSTDKNKSSEYSVEELEKLKFEHRDVRYTPIAKAAVGFFVFMGGASLIAYAFLNYFPLIQPNYTYTKPFKEQAPPLGVPILQTNVTNTEDIVTLREHEKQVMTTTGPTSDPGFYHIPIDKAMAIIAKQGLPQPSPAAAAKSAATAPTPAQRLASAKQASASAAAAPRTAPNPVPAPGPISKTGGM